MDIIHEWTSKSGTKYRIVGNRLLSFDATRMHEPWQVLPTSMAAQDLLAEVVALVGRRGV